LETIYSSFACDSRAGLRYNELLGAIGGCVSAEMTDAVTPKLFFAGGSMV
jgi:hypothetical protein